MGKKKSITIEEIRKNIILPLKMDADFEGIAYINRMIDDIVFIPGDFTEEEKVLLIHNFKVEVTAENCLQVLHPIISTYRKYHDDKNPSGKRLINEIVKKIEVAISSNKLSSTLRDIDQDTPYPDALDKFIKSGQKYEKKGVFTKVKEGLFKNIKNTIKIKKLQGKKKDKQPDTQPSGGNCNYCGKSDAYKKCNYCERRFCDLHIQYENHNCPFLITDGEKGESHRPIKELNLRYVFYLLLGILVIFAIWYFFNSTAIASEKSCADGSASRTCMKFKPSYCLNGGVIDNPSVCGCPDNYRILENKCSLIYRCADGTLDPECSTQKPQQCVKGKLIDQASKCGCPPDYRRVGERCEAIKRCSGGTIYGECSTIKPQYCDNGKIINNATFCGCPDDKIAQDEKCVSKYLTGPQDITLNYVVRGYAGNLKLTTFKGLRDYQATLTRSYTCYNNVCPTDKELALRFLDEPNQKEPTDYIVEQIQKFADNKDDQAMVAISLVQNIPYDYEGLKADTLNNRYPYEVLYDQKGVCGEKSKLMALLLRNLDFGVVLFSYESQSHEAVGIKCPMQYSYEGSGYCFVEPTAPNIITYSQGEYVGAGRLLPNPKIIQISDGASFDSVGEEFKDAELYHSLNTVAGANANILDPNSYSIWQQIVAKYGLKTTG